MQRFDNITKITIITFCTRFHLYIHAYALVLQGRGLSLLQISSIESLVITTLFVAEVPTGVIADRIGRKWSVFMSVLLMMMGEFIFLFSRSYPSLLVIALFTGTGFAFASGATESLVYDSLPPENREEAMKRVMGRVSSVGQIAFFIAPIVGAFILGDLAEARVTVAIALTVTSLFIGVLISLTLREPPTPWHAEKPNTLAIFRSGVAELRGNRKLRRIVLLSVFATTFTGTLVTTLAPPYLNQNDVPVFAIGLALAFGSLMAAFTQRYAYRVEQILGPRWGLAVITLLPGFSYLVLAAVSGPIAAWLLITWMYATNDMKQPLISAYQNAQIASRSRATVLSLINMFVNIFVAVMGPIYAALATQSMPLAFMVMGGVILAGGIVLRVDKLVGVKAEA
jgi:MFS family permease